MRKLPKSVSFLLLLILFTLPLQAVAQQRIAVLAPVTGNVAPDALTLLAATRDQAIHLTGQNGKSISLVIQDSGPRSKNAVQAAKQVIERDGITEIIAILPSDSQATAVASVARRFPEVRIVSLLRPMAGASVVNIVPDYDGALDDTFWDQIGPQDQLVTIDAFDNTPGSKLLAEQIWGRISEIDAQQGKKKKKGCKSKCSKSSACSQIFDSASVSSSKPKCPKCNKISACDSTLSTTLRQSAEGLSSEEFVLTFEDPSYNSRFARFFGRDFTPTRRLLAMPEFVRRNHSGKIETPVDGTYKRISLTTHFDADAFAEQGLKILIDGNGAIGGIQTIRSNNDGQTINYIIATGALKHLGN